MKFLDPTQATNAAQQPVKNGTLQFLQDAHSENATSIIKAMLGSAYAANTPFVLWGCNPTSTIVNQSIIVQYQPGAMFCNDEIFDFTGGNATLASGTTAVFSTNTTQYSPTYPSTLQADPVVFTDGTPHNVHNIRTIQVSTGPVGGTGVLNYICDFGNVQFPQLVLATEINNRMDGDTILQAGIFSVQATVTALQNEIGTVPNGTTVEGQINALGTGWQNITLGTANVTVAQGSGSFGTAPSGNLNYIVIGKTLMCSFNFTFSLSGSVSGIKIIPFSGLTNFAYQGATCGIFFNNWGIQYPTSITWDNTSNDITIYPAGDQGGGGTSAFGVTTGSPNNDGRISGTIMAQLQ